MNELDDYREIDGTLNEELLNEELKKLNNEVYSYGYQVPFLEREIERLHSIIKEAREEIDYWGIEPDRNDNMTFRYALKGILEILDKVEENSK